MDSVESAVAAECGGADRLELCSNLVIGGTTPTPALFERVRAAVSLPIHVLIRPRFGDFLYSPEEYEIIQTEVRQFVSLGADALVIGILTETGMLDTEKMTKISSLCADKQITLHRAFDLCKDPVASIEQAIDLGINTVLTSGQTKNCIEGADCLAALVRQAAGRIAIMVGAGVSADAIAQIEPRVHADAYHMSGKRMVESGMVFRREGVPMGLPGLSEYTLWRADEQAIRAARTTLNQFP